ncbi:MAG: TonB-dependent receptor plug domain-containing protein [Opitutaceae bacterium]|nr:TonB-dependent receptor plug domain-containing protein [Opitutaceae bacterium]
MHKTKQNLWPTSRSVRALLSLAGAALTAGAFAQVAPAPAAEAPKPAATADEEVVVLSPFEVTSESTNGYAAATTLAGNRLNTELRDIGSAVSVITSEFLKDIGATDNRTLLQYTTGSEVGGTYGNFGGNGNGASLDESGKLINPNQNTRIRGLTAADNARDFFLSDIPWDGYSVDGVDLQRGPNSILFGQGSPAGMINVRTKQAMFRNANEVQFRLGSYGANRQSLDVNRVLLDEELALRVAALRNDDQFKQDPAQSMDKRIYGAVRWEPKTLKKNGMRTILKANYEAGQIRSNNPRTLPPMDRITPGSKPAATR